MKVEKLRLGIIGCGVLGVVHTRQFAKLEKVQVAALCDPNPTAREKAAGELPSPPELQTSEYKELLELNLDAVCIATPDGLHVTQVLDSLAAGRHVLCEKPLTLDPNELQRVITSRDSAGKHVAMTYPRRYSGGIRAMRREILSGNWGAVKAITAYNSEDWITPNAGTWRHHPDLCPGGFLYDASGHQLDTLLWTTGLEPEWVLARSDNRGCPVPIVTWGLAQLTHNVPLTFSFVGDGHLWREQVNIHCEGMDFALENGRAHWSREGKMGPIPPDPGEPGEAAFLRLIEDEGPNWAPPEDLWPLLRLTRAALQSSEAGGEVILIG